MTTVVLPPRQPLWPRIRRLWIATGLTATALFTGWSLLAYRASGEAKAALSSDDRVTIVHGSGWWDFFPARGRNREPVGLVFFPGGLVDPVAYAPLLRAVALAGFPASLVEIPRRGAFGGAEDPLIFARVRRVWERDGGPQQWVVAGHSRGGVIACQLVATRPEGLAGVVLIGTSHPRDVSLTSLQVPITKLVGTRDGLASLEKVAANRHLLPASTRWITIEGGNHSQFGWYGFQPGDRFATIAAEKQRAATIEAVLAALRAAAHTRAARE